jgi:hypothetical protein
MTIGVLFLMQRNLFPTSILQKPLQVGSNRGSIRDVLRWQHVNESFRAEHRQREIALWVKVYKKHPLARWPRALATFQHIVDFVTPPLLLNMELVFTSSDNLSRISVNCDRRARVVRGRLA